MKKKRFNLPGILALGLTLAFASCGNPCRDVVCNDGFCVEGDCVCDQGYETSDCSVAFNEKFDGIYSLTETCDSTGANGYLVTVAPSATLAYEAVITGLYGGDTLSQVKATIDWDGMDFTIVSTDIGHGTIASVETCTANASGSTINIMYEFTSDSTSFFEECTAVLIRQ